MFKLWSEISTQAKENLKPDLGLRSWDQLNEGEKEKIWRHLDTHFFVIGSFGIDDYDPDQRYTDENGRFYKFYGPNDKEKRKRIDLSIAALSKLYRVKNYTENYLKTYTHFSACKDFSEIFLYDKEEAVLEMLSLYCITILVERKGKYSDYANDSEKMTKAEIEAWEYEEFDDFAEDLNEVFGDFGVNVFLTRNGFVPKQDSKIIDEVFEPVMKCLSNPQWRQVNNLLADAFSEYRRKTSNGYSTCVTHTVSAIQAFLQILVMGKTGTGDISKLIVQAQKENLIPNDMFTKEIFKNIESILMRERQETGDAHPKKEYASEKNAKLVLNLGMVFLQHCLVS